MTKEQPEQRAILVQNYPNLRGNWDIYIAFIELANMMSKNVICFITPDKWLSRPFGLGVRSKILVNKLSQMVFCGSKVFDGATVDAIISLFISKSFHAKFYRVDRSQAIVFSAEQQLKQLPPPYYVDFLFSSNVDLVRKLENGNISLKSIVTCEGACATSDAYTLSPLLENAENFSSKQYFKLVNTGTLDKFFTKWGLYEITYLGNHLLCPIVKKDLFQTTFGESYIRRSESPKLIIKGLNLLDVALDLTGEFIPGKTTLVICSPDHKTLKFISAILNSKLVLFYLKNKFSSSSYCGGITFTKDMINSVPLPPHKDQEKRSILIDIVDAILTKQTDVHTGMDEINKIVNAWYQLNPEGIATIENF